VLRKRRHGPMVLTFYGLARLGHTDAKRYAESMAARALCGGVQGRDRVPFAAARTQNIIFGILPPIARWCGYRATYPLSRILLAPRS
jgi:hypothetical protein